MLYVKSKDKCVLLINYLKSDSFSKMIYTFCFKNNIIFNEIYSNRVRYAASTSNQNKFMRIVLCGILWVNLFMMAINKVQRQGMTLLYDKKRKLSAWQP